MNARKAPKKNPVKKAARKAPKKNPVKKAARKAPKKNPVKKAARKAPKKNPVKKKPVSYEKLHWGNESSGFENLEVADTRNCALVELGRVVSIVYRTAKGSDVKEEWEHTFGGALPTLAVDKVSNRLVIAGGSYSVDERGIVG